MKTLLGWMLGIAIWLGMTAQVAVLSRVTSIFEDQGVEVSGQERYIAETFCTRFGLRRPILLAPMAGACPPALSIAVANAGGLGACFQHVFLALTVGADRLTLSDAELARAVSALGPEGGPARETWRLMYVEDKSVAEVAALMGVSAGTVKSRAHRARRLMRAALRQHEPLRQGGGQ